MRILIACEESQRVCEAFREKNHEAYSCDILDTSGKHLEWHIKGDVTPLLNGNCVFKTCDGKTHEIPGKWDMIIAFPPCTHLAVSGARHFESKRKDGRQREAIEFFGQFITADCERIAIENPKGIISGNYIAKYFTDLCHKFKLPKKPTQIISPHMFGEPHRKVTCLWLKNLPKLEPTELVEPNLIHYVCSDGRVATFSADYCESKGTDRATKRSKTYIGIAKAMAEQWG